MITTIFSLLLQALCFNG